MKLVLATRNRHKVEEFRRMFEGLPLLVEDLSTYDNVPEVVEDGATFLENARKKALHVAGFTGELALGDDSGLEVDVLAGSPGVLSARFAGEGATDARNREKLLEELRGVVPALRSARFRCAIAIATPDGRVETCEGMCEGRILESTRGEGGFGYDSLFLGEGDAVSFAELEPKEKDSRSHRGRAVEAARLILERLAGDRVAPSTEDALIAGPQSGGERRVPTGDA